LSPILSLISIYVGMKSGGVAGMILGPILVLVLLNLVRSGIFDSLFRDIRMAGRDIAALMATGNKN
jgi:predicted PurR-regulated permease PerM